MKIKILKENYQLDIRRFWHTFLSHAEFKGQSFLPENHSR